MKVRGALSRTVPLPRRAVCVLRPINPFVAAQNLETENPLKSRPVNFELASSCPLQAPSREFGHSSARAAKRAHDGEVCRPSEDHRETGEHRTWTDEATAGREGGAVAIDPRRPRRRTRRLHRRCYLEGTGTTRRSRRFRRRAEARHRGVGEDAARPGLQSAGASPALGPRRARPAFPPRRPRPAQNRAVARPRDPRISGSNRSTSALSG